MSESRVTFREMVDILYTVWYQSAGRKYEGKIKNPYLVYPQLEKEFRRLATKVNEE